MTNYCYYSMRFMNSLAFRSYNCRNMCTICMNRLKENPIKYNILKRNQSNCTAKNTSFSSSLLLKNNVKWFQSNNSFSTTFQRNQRLNQIYRNVNKEKAPNIEMNKEWQQLSEMSLFKKFKVMFKKYWYISIPVHCVTSCLWFGLSYLVAKSGFDIKPLLAKIRPLIERLPLPEIMKKPFMDDTNASDTVGYVAIAFVMYKLLTPARYATTVGTSFYAIKYFVKRGLIKPVPSKEQFKAQVIKSRANLNEVLRERLAKREELRKQIKIKKKSKN